MKLATLRDGTRDGRLVVVSRDLTRATDAARVARTLQAALDGWTHLGPRLADLAESLALGAVPSFRFHEHECSSPLPRAYQWLDASAYLNHAELLRKARGEALPESWRADPLMYQGVSDDTLGPREPIPLGDQAFGADFEAEVAVVLDDVTMGIAREDAAAAIRLVMLVNDVSLRALISGELAKGFGFVQSKPACAFSPVAVTPDELGVAWDGARLSLPLQVEFNGKLFGRADAGRDMQFDFPALVAHAARTRRLGAGTILGSGTVSNRAASEAASLLSAGGPGFSCIAEARTVETILHGAAVTPYLRHGDTVRIEMKNAAGHSIFGAIEQTVTRAGAS